jgi:dihydrofolate synthase/folylpolyglutamate synthase
VTSKQHPRYEESRLWLYGLARGGVKLGLDRMEAICAALDHPERAWPCVIVAGTNGKGSVSAIMHEALVASGIRAALYTSPHLHTVRERIRIGREPISESAFVREVDRLRRVVDRGACPEPTFFEAITAIAFTAMRAAKIEFAVLEVGLGGRLDATNVAKNVRATVITSIGMDHEAYLGTTIEEIAREKAGIARKGVPMIVGVGDPDALRVIRGVCTARKAPLHRARANHAPTTTLRGVHQRDNAGTAAVALRHIGVSETAVRAGLHGVHWPGRLETIDGEPSLLLDAAHNPDGAAALAAYLSTLPKTGRRVLLFGVMADKDWPAMLRSLSPEIDERVYVEPALGRAEKIANLDAFAPGLSASSIPLGLEVAKTRAGAHGLVIVAGSIFVLSEARAAALDIAQEPPIAM